MINVLLTDLILTLISTHTVLILKETGTGSFITYHYNNDDLQPTLKSFLTLKCKKDLTATRAELHAKGKNSDLMEVYPNPQQSPSPPPSLLFCYCGRECIPGQEIRRRKKEKY